MKVNVTLSFFTSMLLTMSCSNKIEVKRSNYTDKVFGEMTEQRVDLGKYKSPNLREDQDPDRLIVMAASGGGSRAASLTIGIMLELERIILDDRRNVLKEIDYVSTVSGGGWGSSAYIAYLHQKNKYGITPLTPYENFNAFELHLADWANQRYARYQLPYFLKDALFRLGPRTSGDLLMDKLNKGYLGWRYRKGIEKTLSKKNGNRSFDRNAVDPIRLSDVFVLAGSSDTPKMPMLIANTSSHDNFFLIPFTPDRLAHWGVLQYTLTVPRRIRHYPEHPQSVLTLPELQQIPLAAGIKASSGVPVVISNSFFKSRKDTVDYYLRLQDGGVVDNQGLHTVLSIFNQEKDVLDPKNRFLIIVDASGSGIVTARPNGKNARRNKSLRNMISAVPDAQYALMRERLKGVEKQCACNVIYLSTEALLNPDLGSRGIIPKKLTMKKSDAKKAFYSTYNQVLKDNNYYSTKATMKDRSLLYEYISSEIPTWFTTKNSKHGGELIMPEDTKGSAKILFLAGRAIVQLKKDDILAAFEINNK